MALGGREVQIIIKAIDKASGVFDDVGKKAGGLQGALSTLGTVGGLALAGITAGVTAIGTAAVGAGAILGKMAVDAAPLVGIQQAFEGVTEGGDEMLAMLRESSLGMVRDTDLMLNYNKAAQLVSKTFADQLPDAMVYLTKVSASTGTDVDYLMNSLVTGVGRVSPLILDNLGIQVSLAEATERATEMFGLQADELSKEQQQAALMALVLEKLEENTAALPEIAGQASTSWAALMVSFQNIKDQIGISLVPALQTLLEAIAPIVAEYGPRLVKLFGEKIVPVVESVAGALALLLEGDVQGALQTLFGEDRAAQIMGFADAVSAAYDNIMAFINAPISEKLGLIWQGLVDIVTEFPTHLLTLSEVLLEWSENEAVRDALRGVGDKIGRWMFDGLIEMIRGAAGQASGQQAVEGFAYQIMAATVNLQQTFANVGLAIAEGLIAGFIEQIVGEETARRIAQAVVTALAKAVPYITPVGQAKLLWDLISSGVQSAGTAIGEAIVNSPAPMAQSFVQGMQSPAPQSWLDLQSGGGKTDGDQVQFHQGAIQINVSGQDAETVRGAVQDGLTKALRAAGVA